MLIFLTFVGGTFFVSGSPLVDQSSAEVDLKQEAEMALVEVEKNGLTDEYGEYDTAVIEETIESGFSDDITLSEDYEYSLQFNQTDSSPTPQIFLDNGDEVDGITVGESPQETGSYTTMKVIDVDGVPVEVRLTVWKGVE